MIVAADINNLEKPDVADATLGSTPNKIIDGTIKDPDPTPVIPPIKPPAIPAHHILK